MKSVKITVKYAMVNGFYVAMLCTMIGFASVYMVNKGYSNSMIGMILAMANILAVFLQPMVASVADRNPKMTLKRIVWGFIVVMLAVSIIQLSQGTASLVLSGCILLNVGIISTVQPFINSMSVRFQQQGIELNFGLCRACGFGSERKKGTGTIKKSGRIFKDEQKICHFSGGSNAAFSYPYAGFQLSVSDYRECGRQQFAFGSCQLSGGSSRNSWNDSVCKNSGKDILSEADPDSRNGVRCEIFMLLYGRFCNHGLCGTDVPDWFLCHFYSGIGLLRESSLWKSRYSKRTVAGYHGDHAGHGHCQFRRRMDHGSLWGQRDASGGYGYRMDRYCIDFCRSGKEIS